MFAVLVIYSHSFTLGLGSQSTDYFAALTRGQMSGGNLAVGGFFIISGFLVTSSIMRSTSVWSYLRKRILRVYPGFILLTVLTIAIVIPLSSGHLAGEHIETQVALAVWKTVSLSDLKYSGAFSSNPFPGVINGSLWTIRFEFLCYIGLAVLSICGVLRRRRLCLALFALWLIVGFGIAVFHPTIRQYGYGHDARANDWDFVIRLVPAYLAGVVGYLYVDKLLITKSRIAGAVALLTAAVFIPHGMLIAMPLAVAYLILCFARSNSVRLHEFGKYGDFSYGTYLYAFPIQQLVMSEFRRPVSWEVLFVISTPLAIIAAAVSWHLVEKHFLFRSRVVRRHWPVMQERP
jgi:peptidoglycan/LPS O-acetylase OafA/YrhL